MKLGRLIGWAALGAVVAAEAAWVPVAPAHGDKYDHDDFGLTVERLLADRAERWFGFGRPLARPSDATDYVPREAAGANDRVRLAEGLHARFVARNVARSGDMIALWPNEDHYSHLIVCIEQGRAGATPLGNGGLNASVQRVNVATGQVDTILHGMSGCDGIRATPWGTVLATEEQDDGRAYEIIEPLDTTDHWVADRATGDVRDGVDSPTPSARVAQRQALPTMAWEGLAVLPSGVVIGGDEQRPGSDGLLDSDGGAIFKFVPAGPPAAGPVASLAESPLAAGSVYAMSTSCQGAGSSSFPQYGQGCEVGVGAWVRVNALTARADADAFGATGYYRPEDLHDDPRYDGEGVRFCWTNTGNESSADYAEVVCGVDPTPAPADPTPVVDGRTGLEYLGDGGAMATVTVNRFVEGDTRFNSFDNLAFQPGTGNVYVIEDHPFGEVWACLPDGADRDLKSDGCVALLSVADPEAEPTGFVFDGTGRRAFLIVQHGEAPASLADLGTNPVDGRTDDLLMITGFGGGHGHR